jgi:pantoate--beta-alanine ligase
MIVRTVQDLRALRRALPASTPVGFVPTMGSLHEGHLTLVDRAKQPGGMVWASIFVNPSQFAPHEDFSKYPRSLESDVEKLRARGVSVVFAPAPGELYPDAAPNQTSLGVQRTVVMPAGVEQDRAEGRARPGHFAGVATVVTKLLNVCQPTHAVFGQKDGLQCIVIKQTVRDLNIPVDVIICDTMREPDGLAMSSRNVYLTPEQRVVAPVLNQSLRLVKAAFDQGERSYDALRQLALANMDRHRASFRVDYVSIVNADNAVEVDGAHRVPERLMCSSAINFGNVRLLDNVMCDGASRAP